MARKIGQKICYAAECLKCAHVKYTYKYSYKRNNIWREIDALLLIHVGWQRHTNDQMHECEESNGAEENQCSNMCSYVIHSYRMRSQIYKHINIHHLRRRNNVNSATNRAIVMLYQPLHDAALVIDMFALGIPRCADVISCLILFKAYATKPSWKLLCL